MKRIEFSSVNTARLVDIQDVMPRAGEVSVRMAYTAISAGTERANLIGDPNVSGGNKRAPVSFPRVSGYSGSGIIERVGEGVDASFIGKRAVTYWGLHQSVNTLPLENVVIIDDDSVSMLDAAFVFISTFSLSAVRKLRIELGESCLVAGAGLLGLFSVQFARLSGAVPVICADTREDRRELAARMGADAVLDPASPDYAARVKALTHGRGANAVVEATGNPVALNQALECASPFARVALLGCTRAPVTLDLYHDVHFPGISLIGAHTNARAKSESYPGYWTHADDIRASLKYLARGRLNISDIITEVRAPGDAPGIYERLATDADFPIGVAFNWAGTQV